MKEDLTFGEDRRGDYALFIENFHFGLDGWSVDDEVKAVVGSDTVFFRVIVGGEQTSSHGWIEGGNVVQWG